MVSKHIDCCQQGPVPQMSSKCRTIGNIKNRKRIWKKQRISKSISNLIPRPSTIDFSSFLTLFCISQLVNCELDAVAFAQCHEHLQNAWYDKLLRLHQGLNQINHEWISLTIVYKSRRHVVVKHDTKVSQLFQIIKTKFSIANIESFYIKCNNKPFHHSQQNQCDLNLKQIGLNNNSVIEIIGRLKGGSSNRKRKRSDKEEMSETDDEMFPQSKRQKLSLYKAPIKRKRGQKRKRGPQRKKTSSKRGRKYDAMINKRLQHKTFDWDSKKWAQKMFHKIEQEQYHKPIFKTNGGIDNFDSQQDVFKECYIGKMEHECPHCGALLFKSELSTGTAGKWQFCCKNGKIKMESKRPPPEELHNLFTASTKQAQFFRDNIMTMNNALAFSSSLIKRKELPHSNGKVPPTFILSGAVYHTVPKLTPADGTIPKHAQVYTWDPQEEFNNALNQGFLARVSREPQFKQLLKQLQNTLHNYNWIVKTYKSIFQQYINGLQSIPQLKLIIHGKVNDKTNLGHYKQFSKPTKNSPIATIVEFGQLTDDVPTHRKLLLTTHDGEDRTLCDFHTLSDAFAFPLLFPYGESSYDLDYIDSVGKKITMTEYYRYMLLERKGIWNPFIHGQRLFQKFITSTWGKIQQNNMNYIIQNQKKCRADSYESIKKAKEVNSELKNLGKKLNILPKSFVESPRYFRSKYQNAMAILRQLRSKPDFFITFTANANWKEVKETMSMHNVTMDCRDDVIARVFNAKLKLFLHDLFKSNALGMYFYKCQTQPHVICF